jgi:hypothetical protein
MLRAMAGKAGWVIPLLCVLVFAQAVAVALPHSHHQSPEHCCQLCHFASGMVIEPALHAQAVPPIAAAYMAWAATADPTLDPFLSHESSRAPPA